MAVDDTPMQREPLLLATFTRQAALGADSAAMAATAGRTWLAIEAVMAPVIGYGGVAALYRRSVHLARRDHPGLVVPPDGAPGTRTFDTLQAALSLLPPGQAAAANDALLRTFHDLLASLIGAALTDQLLGSVWEQTGSNGPGNDDNPSP